MRKSPKSQQITVLFSWSLPLHGKAEPYFFFRIIAYCTWKCNSILHMEMQLSQRRNGRKKCDFISARQYLSKKYLDFKV